MTGLQLQFSTQQKRVLLFVLAIGVCICVGFVLAVQYHYLHEDIHRAARAGDVVSLQKTLDRYPDRIDRRNKLRLTPLHEAAWRGKVATLELLIQRGAGMNETASLSYGDGSWNALHICTIEGHVAAAATLIRAGTDVNQKSTRGETPLDLAIENGHGELARLLFAHGAKTGTGK